VLAPPGVKSDIGNAHLPTNFLGRDTGLLLLERSDSLRLRKSCFFMFDSLI
jgi:hypothetical protein